MRSHHVSVTLFIAALLALTATLATAQAREVAVNEVTVRGTVEAIDYAARVVSVRGPQGNLGTFDVPASATRFDQVKVGDIVTISYYDRIALRLKPAGEPAVDTVADPTTTTAAGLKPGGTIGAQRIVTVTITGWDPATRMVTFTGPKGKGYSRYVAETVDPTIISSLKVGDRVDVIYSEALRLSVESGAQAASPDSLRHRLTVSALFGWDNQFSGKMIQEATGRTTGGAPINVNETSFDDVYGRMGMFKVGVGYRITPRTEAVVNFVLSSSDSEETATPVGTVGTSPQVPLAVNFTQYKYWGVEGGQRWFFARTRFTPYLGYLVGINRHQDIRGTFVGVPASLTPGLAAQDGKFFEKSWAFSLGPTGGILIGVGPFEVMAETQFRYLGGLSDVDWLVEEGLRDINSESSRWSFPILVGARIRF